jgi:alkylation response protein AidB-like acyl-CoA dehydrogenase
MNLSSDIIQEVTELNMAIHGAAGFSMNAEANKLVRDGIIWTHLAGDTSQRLKVIRRFPKK